MIWPSHKRKKVVDLLHFGVSTILLNRLLCADWLIVFGVCHRPETAEWPTAINSLNYLKLGYATGPRPVNYDEHVSDLPSGVPLCR